MLKSRLFAKVLYRLCSYKEKFVNFFRINLLRLQGAEIGQNVTIGKGFWINWPHQLKIGDNVRIGGNARITVDGVLSYIGRVDIDSDTEIRDNFLIWKTSDSIITLGSKVMLNTGVEIYSCVGVSLGKGCIVGPRTLFFDVTHEYGKAIIDRLHCTKANNVRIGENVWICAKCVIAYGAIIKSHSVIAASSLVTGEVPEWEVWGGSPATKIKNIQ